MEVCLGAVVAHLRALETHPGTLESHSGAMEAHPGALEAGALHAHPKETSCLAWFHGGTPWGQRCSTWTRRGLSWSRGASPWSLGGSPYKKAHPGPVEVILGPWGSSLGWQAHPEVLHAHLEPFLPTLGLWRLTLDPWRFIF